MGRQRPGSVTSAIRAQIALVGVGRPDHPVDRSSSDDELVRPGPVATPPGSTRPQFVPVAVVLFITFALLAAVLVVFFRGGHGTARVALTVLAGLLLLAMIAVLRLDPPVLFVVLAVICALLDLVLLYFLWHKDTSEFLRGAALAARTR